MRGGPPKLLLLCCNYGLITVKTGFPPWVAPRDKMLSHTHKFKIKNMFKTATKFANLAFFTFTTPYSHAMVV
jgi:hypothetical protein